MIVETTQEPIAEIKASAVVVGHFQDGPLSPHCQQLDSAIGGTLARLLELKELSGKLAETTTLLAPAGIQAERIVVVGLGPQDKFDRGAAFKSAAAASKELAKQARGRVAFFPREGIDSALIESGVCGSIVAVRGQDLYRADKKLHRFQQLVWSTEHDHAVRTGQILADGINLTRELVNEPPNKMFPAAFAARAEQVAREHDLECEVWDQKRLEAERCGALLAVARGSEQPPRLVVLRYQGAEADQAPLALVGKGVTFDSGGLSLKPSDSMKSMKCDMAGAATVLGAMQTIARLKPQVNVLAVMGLVENMISGDAYKLGDVLTARNGRTIEVMNTDAEGRLVLADALDVAVERGAAHVIDLATLTGACVVALGKDVAGLMTNNQGLCDRVSRAANSAGEQVWQLPMFSEFGEQIKSKVADIKNTGEGRWGGAMTAAKFLEEFVKCTPWVHIDIAGPAFLDSEQRWLDAGGSGALVRTLVEVVRHWK